MALNGIFLDRRENFAKDWRNILVEILNDGILNNSCKVTFTSNSITVGDGYFILKGAIVNNKGAETIPITPTLTNGYVRLKCRIDLTKEASETGPGQVSWETEFSATTTFPALTQEDINGTGAVYEGEIAVLQIVNGNITALTRSMGPAEIDAELLGGKLPGEYLQTSGIQKLNGKFWIAQDNTHLRMMQSAPTGSVGGWYVDDYYKGNTLMFRIATLNASGNHIANILTIDPSGLLELLGNIQAHEFRVNETDGSVFLKGGTHLIRLHCNDANRVFLHRYNADGTSVLGTPVVIEANNDIAASANVSASNFRVGKVDGYVELMGNSHRIRFHCDNNNNTFIHRFDSSGNLIGTIATIDATNRFNISALSSDGTYSRTTTIPANTVITDGGNGYFFFRSTSLRSAKRNIKDITEEEAMKGYDLRARSFEGINEGQDDFKQFGLVAEEVKEVLPELATYGDGKLNGVAYERITAILLKQNQMQKKQMDEQGQRIDKLESENAALKSLLVSKGLLTQGEIDGLEV